MRKPIVLKRPGWRAAGLAVLFGLGLISNPVQSAPASGGDTVQRLYDALLSTMKNGRRRAGRREAATGLRRPVR